MPGTLADTGAIAWLLDVPAATIRTWARRYPVELPRQGTRGRRTLYDVTDAKRLHARLRHAGPGGHIDNARDVRQHQDDCRSSMSPASQEPA